MSYGLVIKNNISETFISPNVTPLNFIKKIDIWIPKCELRRKYLYLNTGIPENYIVLPFIRVVGETENAPGMISKIRSENGMKIIEITHCHHSGFSLEIYLFANFVPKLTNYGLEIFNDNNEIVYNNTCKPLDMQFCKKPDFNLFGKTKGIKERESVMVNLGFPVAVLCTVYGNRVYDDRWLGLAVFDIFCTAINESAGFHVLLNVKATHKDITKYPNLGDIPFIDVRKYQ